MPPNPEKMEPNQVQEDQDMELKPIVFGPPAYGSPDPNTNRLSLNDALIRTGGGSEDEDSEEASENRTAAILAGDDPANEVTGSSDEDDKPVKARGKQ